MGIALTELLVMKEVELNELTGKVFAVDAPMWLYQFLSSIRQRDGTLLMDSKGNVTSHLMGIFTRVTNLISKNIKLAFVFDGKAPELKLKTTEKRKEIKLEAEREYEKAKEKKDTEAMKKYAARTSRLTQEMIEESKKLIQALGLPIIEAPSEAEAQASYIAKKGKAFAIATNDADALMFGAPKLVRNLSIVGKKKKAATLSYETVKPEIVDLSENLNNLGIDQNQLITLAMLIGTDYNVGGIKGIGPKNALKLVKKYKTDFDALFVETKWSENFDFPWTDVYHLIKNISVTDNFHLEWEKINVEKIKKLLVDEHDFSEERVNTTLEKLSTNTTEKQQKGLGEFF